MATAAKTLLLAIHVPHLERHNHGARVNNAAEELVQTLHHIRDDATRTKRGGLYDVRDVCAGGMGRQPCLLMGCKGQNGHGDGRGRDHHHADLTQGKVGVSDKSSELRKRNAGERRSRWPRKSPSCCGKLAKWCRDGIHKPVDMALTDGRKWKRRKRSFIERSGCRKQH